TAGNNGKVVWELNIGAGVWGSDRGYGLANLSAALGTIASAATGAVICYTGNFWYQGANHGTSKCPGNGQANITIMIAVNLNTKLWWAQSSNNAGQWNVQTGVGSADPVAGTGGNDYSAAGLDAVLYPVVTFQGATDCPFTLNSVGPFVNTAPS